MNIVLVGLNHRTAPVALREQFSLANCGLRMALEDLKPSHQAEQVLSRGQPREAVILSTCNRLEVYATVSGDPQAGRDFIEAYLAHLQGVSRKELYPHLYSLLDQQAVLHLMRVAAGLDSMVLGEPQILGQVSGAQEDARRTRASGPILNHLFDLAVHAGKRAQNETDIGRYSTSVSHTAVRLIKDELNDLSTIKILVIGAAEMAEAAARALFVEGVREMTFINRTYARAETMVREFGGKALNWYQLPDALATSDVILTATGAPHVVIQEDDVIPALEKRGGRLLHIVDIAVPRDVEATVGQLPGVNLFDIDQLQSVVDANLSQRKAAVPDVEHIIEQEAARFSNWLHGREVLPVLVELRRKARIIAESELQRQRHRLSELPPADQELVDIMVRRIVNKLLHEPTVRLKAAAAEGNGVDYAHTLCDLFALNAEPKTTGSSNNGQIGALAQPVDTTREPIALTDNVEKP